MPESRDEPAAEMASSEPRPLLEEAAYEASKLKELGWSRTATRVRPLKGWFGLAHESEIFTGKVDVHGTRRVLEQVERMERAALADE